MTLTAQDAQTIRGQLAGAKIKPHKATELLKALRAGQRAKQNGWSRELCPYDDEAGVYYFRCGFDGYSLHDIAKAQYNLQGLSAADPVFIINRPVLVRERFTGGWNETGQAFIQ
jgi:ribosome modulation factor